MKEMADAPEESEPVSVYLRFRRIFGDGSSRSADAIPRSGRCGRMCMCKASGQ